MHIQHKCTAKKQIKDKCETPTVMMHARQINETAKLPLPTKDGDGCEVWGNGVNYGGGGGGGDEIVESLMTFQYLGRPLDQTDDDWLGVWRNIMRLRLVWGILGTLL